MARSGHCTRGFEMEASSGRFRVRPIVVDRSEEHTSELQSLTNLVCRLLLVKKKVLALIPARPESFTRDKPRRSGCLLSLFILGPTSSLRPAIHLPSAALTSSLRVAVRLISS